MCDHVVHSASKCHELINILTNAALVTSPKAVRVLANPLLISTRNAPAHSEQNVSQLAHVTCGVRSQRVQ